MLIKIFSICYCDYTHSIGLRMLIQSLAAICIVLYYNIIDSLVSLLTFTYRFTAVQQLQIVFTTSKVTELVRLYIITLRA